MQVCKYIKKHFNAKTQSFLRKGRKEEMKKLNSFRAKMCNKLPKMGNG